MIAYLFTKQMNNILCWRSQTLIKLFCSRFSIDVTLWYHHTVQLVSSVRQRKDELEQRMSTLQESRRELMVQLEQLMMLLKVPETCLSSLSLHSSHIQMKSPSQLLKEDTHTLFPLIFFFLNVCFTARISHVAV